MAIELVLLCRVSHFYCQAECRYAKCHYSDCRDAVCHYAGYHFFVRLCVLMLSVIVPIVVMLGDVMLRVTFFVRLSAVMPLVTPSVVVRRGSIQSVILSLF